MKGVALLRAINVGGHVVKMDRLRKLFEQAGFTGVETFIASGNVAFDLASSTKLPTLERTIETMLKEALGYEVSTFIRTDRELRAVAEHEAFTPSALKQGLVLNVAFVKDRLDTSAARTIAALATSSDDFEVRGREIYWLLRVRQSESKMSGAVLERALRRQSTVRGISTVRKLAEKYGS